VIRITHRLLLAIRFHLISSLIAGSLDDSVHLFTVNNASILLLLLIVTIPLIILLALIVHALHLLHDGGRLGFGFGKLGLFLVQDDVLLYRRHERLILRHLFERFTNIFQQQQVWELRIQLQEITQVLMNGVLGADTLFVEHAEEIFRLHENHHELLRLGLHVLFKTDFLEEVLCREVGLEQVHHEHDHNLD